MVAGVATPALVAESAVSADVVFVADSTGHRIRANVGEPLQSLFDVETGIARFESL